MHDRLDIVDGDLLIDDGRPVRVDVSEAVATARAAARIPAARAQLIS